MSEPEIIKKGSRILLENVTDIKNFSQGKMVALYGKSGSGKTTLGATFPKPMLYVKIGDDGSSVIKDVDGIDAVEISKVSEINGLIKELEVDKKYKSVFFDTFTLIVNEWKNENIVSKKKKMTQQSWGDLLTDTEEIVRKLHRLSKNKWVIISGHEVIDSIEGMEDELLPDVRIAVSKGARTYLEGMVNYGLHTLVIEKEVEKDGETVTVTKHAVDIGPNPYYWTKFQTVRSKKVPKRMMNPTFDKLQQLMD